MKTTLPQDISDFAAVATKRLNRLGGPQAALHAETDDSIRDAAHAALSEVGAFALDARSSVAAHALRAGGQRLFDCVVHAQVQDGIHHSRY